MATPGAETILITVDIVSNTARLVELQKQLNDNRAAMQALTKANAEGRLSNDELAAGQQRLKQQATATTGEIKVLTRANEQQIAINKAAAGSVDELKAKSALLTTQYNALSEAQRTGTDEGRKLGAELKKTNDALKATGAAVSDTRRSVGDYNAGVKDVNVVNGQLVGGLRTAVDKGLSPFRNELDRGTGLLGKFKSGSDLVNKGLQLLKGSGETGALGFKAVAGGIALTGIGLFVIAISAVVGYFTQTNEGSKILKQGLAALGAVVTTVANVFFGAGKGLVKVFTEPKEALNGLLDFLKSQVVNRLAAFGLLIDGIRNRDFKKITDSIIQFNLGITNGTDKAAAYAKGLSDVASTAGQIEAQLQKLKKSRAEMEIDEVKEKGRVDELIKLSKDRTLSAAERLNKLREAGRVESELSAKSLKQTTDELALIQKRNELKGLSKTSDEIQEERDKRKEFNATVAERNSTLATIKARQSRFILEEATELKNAQKDRAAAAQKAREDAVKNKQTEVEQLLLTVQKESAAELALLQKKVDLAAALTLASEKKNTAERALILATAEVEKRKLQDDFNKKTIEAAKQHAAAEVAESNREYAEAQRLLEEYLDNKRAAILNGQTRGVIGEEEAQRRLDAVQKAGNQAALVNAKDYAKDTAAIAKKSEEDEIKRLLHVKDEKKRVAALEEQIREASFKAASDASDAVIGLFGAESDAGQVALGIKKTVALAEIAINLEKQLSANHLAAAKIAESAAPYTVPLGIAYEVAEDAAAIAGALLSASKIAGFKSGGYVSGPGTGTSDSIPARLSNGESVMNANTTAMFAPLLSHLNVLGGGVAFASGGLVPGAPTRPASINDGGLLARQLGNGAPLIDYQALAKAMQQVTVEANFVSFDKGRRRYDAPRALSTLG